ncbi:hypothetical protein Clacol_006568 [Clathrus columnatus]|uniref:Uncharacterized protein n=1 Tax=Clathrus columnatus TaxID=1419009 RepID=A0AAV5AF89_9AGAM|nr:hypothetical protein Clacol_006568 [Clathrus columnatus]
MDGDTDRGTLYGVLHKTDTYHTQRYEALFGLHQYVNNNNGIRTIEWSWHEVADIIHRVVEFVANPDDVETYTIRRVSLQLKHMRNTRGFRNHPNVFTVEGAPVDRTSENTGPIVGKVYILAGPGLVDDKTSPAGARGPSGNKPTDCTPFLVHLGDPKVRSYVRTRDNKCCVSGERVIGKDYARFQVAHLFERANSNQTDGRTKFKVLQAATGYFPMA